MNQKNTRKQGDVGLGVAIGCFAKQGLTISIPLTDNQEYDLILDMDGDLKKVQCKTTRYKRNGVYQVLLKTCGGNQTNSSMKTFDSTKTDILFVYDAEGNQYVIPSSEIQAKHSMSLGSKFSKYLVD